MTTDAPSSPPVARARCFRLVSGLPIRGCLTVDQEHLRFDALGLLGRALGDSTVEVALGDIDEVRVAGVDRHIVVVCGERTLRFTGRGARDLLGPLQVLRAAAWHPGGAAVIDLFGSPDHAVIRGPGRLFVNRLMAVPGTVALSSRRLTFTPTSRLETWAWGTGLVELDLRELRDLRMTGLRATLQVQDDRRTWRLGGPLSPALFGAIRILQGGELRAAMPPGERELFVDAWPARFGRGGHAEPGTLVIGSHRLVFVPSSHGPVDELPLHAVTRLHVDPTSSRRLTLRLGDRIVNIHAVHAAEHARELARLLLAVRTPEEPPVLRNGEIEPEAFEAQLVPWIDAGLLSPPSEGERVQIAGAALQWVDGSNARRGWLGLTQQRAVFLPTGGPSAGEAPTELQLTQQPPDEIFGERSVVLGPDPPAQLLPRGGRLFVEAFWAAWRRLRPSTVGSVRGAQVLEAVLGTALYVQLLDSGEALVTLPYACISRDGDGLALGFQGTPDASLDVGRDLRVEVARVDGLYHFQATVRAMDRAEEPATGVRLVLALRSDVQRVEHRAGFRVKADARVDITLLERRRDTWVVADTVDGCALDDLSIVGCGLWSPGALPEGARLHLALPLADGELVVHGVVARFDSPRVEGGPWRYGLQFVGLPESSRDRLHADMLGRQRAEARMRREAEDAEPPDARRPMGPPPRTGPA